jgi:hypothetical protein
MSITSLWSFCMINIIRKILINSLLQVHIKTYPSLLAPTFCEELILTEANT